MAGVVCVQLRRLASDALRQPASCGTATASDHVARDPRESHDIPGARNLRGRVLFMESEVV